MKESVLKALASMNLMGSYYKLFIIALSMVGFIGGVAVSSAQCGGGPTTCTQLPLSAQCTGSVSGVGCQLVTQGCPTNEGFCGVPGQSGGGGGGGGSGASGVASEISTICTEIKTVVFVLGLALMILGGALYAGAHVMPGTTKGQIQGYGMGMLIGGIIGVIIALLAPFVLKQIITFSGTGVAPPSC